MITLSPIGTAKNERQALEDDNRDEVVSMIELNSSFTEEALLQIEEFSHAKIIYYFHLEEDGKMEMGARPRNNKDWPKSAK